MRSLLSAVFAICLPAPAIAADDGRAELGAHEHGAGVFNMAMEDNTVAIELEAPGADIVGFEHKARSDADRAAVQKARTILGDLKNVAELPEAARCELKSADVELHGGDGHTEFHAEYVLNCAAPQNLTGFSFTYFQSFNNARELDVSIIGPGGQKKLEATREDSTVDLGGIM